MKIAFRRFEPGDEAAIARSNQRLRDGGFPHEAGGEPAGAAEPSFETQPILERMFVALDGDEVRGSVWLKEQHFWTAEGELRMGWMVFPVSESLIDKRFAGIPGTLLFGLLRQQPRLMALGMGGAGGPFAKLLAGARWSSTLVPFWFHVVRPARFLRRLAPARSNAFRRLISDALSGSGLAWAGNRLLGGARRLLDARARGDAHATPVDAFGDWADALWERSRGAYGLVAVRDARALNALYPASFDPITRLRVQRGGEDLGWVCTQSFCATGTPYQGYFGDARVGTVTDAFASPEDAVDVFDAGVRQLLSEGVDVVLTNQMHPAWCAAARAAGFWRGPSNLAFSWSPAAEKGVPGGLDSCLLTRSDCDGPMRRVPEAPTD